MHPLLQQPLQLAELSLEGRSILCLGLGGGSDAISACLAASILEAHGATQVAYGNTRGRFDEAVTLLSSHLGRFDGPPEPLSGRAAHGTTQIDRSLPRGPGDSPLVVLLERSALATAPETLAPQLDARGYDLIVGVDTGGDVLRRRRARSNRDRVMLEVIRATRAEAMVLVFGPGSDGTRPSRILPEAHRIQAAGGYLGCLGLTPWIDRLAQLSTGLPPSRTPQILLRALRSPRDPQLVERGARVEVPRILLTHVLGFAVSAM